MNEFMKEELELIESYFIKEDVVPDKPYIHLSLLRKIQTMIDNYPKEIDRFIRETQNYIICNHDWNGLEMDKLKKAIITHLLKGIQMERISKEYKLAVPKEQLEGFRDGLRWVLKTIPLLKARNE